MLCCALLKGPKACAVLCAAERPKGLCCVLLKNAVTKAQRPVLCCALLKGPKACAVLCAAERPKGLCCVLLENAVTKAQRPVLFCALLKNVAQGFPRSQKQVPYQLLVTFYSVGAVPECCRRPWMPLITDCCWLMVSDSFVFFCFSFSTTCVSFSTFSRCSSSSSAAVTVDSNWTSASLHITSIQPVSLTFCEAQTAQPATALERK